jgi:hypothetical protein
MRPFTQQTDTGRASKNALEKNKVQNTGGDYG